jgi:hypothetical protein
MACHINDVAKMRGLEIVDDLIDLVADASPNGVSFSQAAQSLDMERGRFSRAANQLSRIGRIKVDRGASLRWNGLILLWHWETPVRPITDKQREVLNLLCSCADEQGIARLSFKQIAERTSCRAPSMTLDRLDVKGFIQVVARGNTHQANSYRVYPNGDGPRGYSWP